MSNEGSLRSRIGLWLDSLVDGLDARAPRLDTWSFWTGVVFGLIAVVVTYLHHAFPNHALTEDLIEGIAATIRTVHGWMLLPVADLMTYASALLIVVGLILRVAKWLYRKGGTKSS